MISKWRQVATKTTRASRRGFLDAILVWLRKPHVINKRLCTAKILSEETVNLDLRDSEKITEIALKYGMDDSKLQFLTLVSDEGNEDLAAEGGLTEMTVTVRALLPKQPDRWPVLEEIIIMVPDLQRAVFIPSRRYMEVEGREQGTTQDDLPYMFTLLTEPSSIILSVFSTESSTENTDSSSTPTNNINCSLEWLEGVLLTKIARWSEETGLNTEVTSLKLIPVDRYNQKYQELKTKYGQPLAKIWPESTDPQKFVYEDVAIASYLLTLWECERTDTQTEDRQTFVDLGCGNGLLVYLLTQEGHKGIGIDVRRRKIWDLYGNKADLRESSITPGDDCLFPEYDWLIGNHSDELTPWIPVIAARSSYNTRYFVLPCCLWDFTSKFTEKSGGVSQYQTYLGYIQEVGEVCGFSVAQDVLRIPSTKRACLIGGSRTYESSTEAEVDTRRSQFIATRCQHSASTPPPGVKHTNQGETAESGGHSSEPVSGNNEETDTTNTLPPGERDEHHCHPVGAAVNVNENESSIKHSQDCEQYTEEGLPPNQKKVRLNHGTDLDAVESQVNSQGHTTSVKDTTSVTTHNCTTCGSASSETHPTCHVTSQSPSSGSGKAWSTDFTARQEDTRPRNCMRVDQRVKDSIVDKVFRAVLENEESRVLELSDGKTWNLGGRVPLSSVAAMFDKTTLSELKDECGGLQTLLRNCHHIFMVQGGHVELRDWITTDQSKRLNDRRKRKGQPNKTDADKLRKTKLCYFHDNHPEGCPLVADECRFAHGSDELVLVDSHDKPSISLDHISGDNVIKVNSTH